MCNRICVELYENISGEKAVTSPARRTRPTSIVVAMETVRWEALSFHRPQMGKLRPKGRRIRSNNLGRKKAA